VYSKIKILGHPIHPMLVSYPIAMYTLTLVGWALYILGYGYQWVWIAIAANVIGVIMAVLAAIPGFLDWATGIPSGSPARRHGMTHMALNVTALILFLINAVIHVQYWNFTPTPHSAIGGLLALVGVACTIAAGYFGWTMVQDDHVGVNLTPEQERLESAVTSLS
jgi:uncharacterized membrane protein